MNPILASFFSDTRTFIAEFRTLFLFIMAVAVMVGSVAIGAARRSVVAAFGSFLVGMLLWAFMYNTTKIRTGLTDDFFTAPTSTPVVQEVL